MVEFLKNRRSSVIKWFPYLLLLCFCSVLFTSAEAKIRHHKWELKYEFKSPDCFKKLVITINGRSPGPTINAEVGDTIVVELKNHLLTENVAIHWHGIRQVNIFLKKTEFCPSLVWIFNFLIFIFFFFS